MSDLPKRLRIKAGMIQLGEIIAWGSDAEIMEEAADEIDDLLIKLSIAQSQLGALHTESAMKREMAAKAANPFHGMWQDAAGTIPVTAVGQPVGRHECDGEVLMQKFAANRPTSMGGGHFTMPAQTVETPQHARDSAELRRLCAARDQLKAENERLRQRIADGLRWRAREIRNAAQYAERLSDARAELASAHRMEVEADQLEGKVAPVVERPVQPNAEEIAARRRARMDAAIAELEQRFGPNREKPLTK